MTRSRSLSILCIILLAALLCVSASYYRDHQRLSEKVFDLRWKLGEANDEILSARIQMEGDFLEMRDALGNLDFVFEE